MTPVTEVMEMNITILPIVAMKTTCGEIVFYTE